MLLFSLAGIPVGLTVQWKFFQLMVLYLDVLACHPSVLVSELVWVGKRQSGSPTPEGLQLYEGVFLCILVSFYLKQSIFLL